jgi:hypothetical protein
MFWRLRFSTVSFFPKIFNPTIEGNKGGGKARKAKRTGGNDNDWLRITRRQVEHQGSDTEDGWIDAQEAVV